MIEVDVVKGFQDFLPQEAIKRREIKKIIEKWFQLYGFYPIETPIVEFDELMKSHLLPSEQEDEAISDRFRLRDRGGRALGLRYEFTFQLARILKMYPNLKFPFRRYQIGEVFRDEPVSSNRFRQFTQCDVDIIGDSSINADAECLSLFSDILRELKIDFDIEVNNRALLFSIIESCEISSVREVMRALDKINKIGEDEVKSEIKKFANTNQILTLFKLFGKDLSFFKKNAFAGAEELENLIETSNLYGVKVKFNPFLVRGFAYYTGNVFEIFKVGDPKKISIAGGGRYDKLVGRYLNREIPAVGISFGLERLTEISNIKIPAQIKVVVISINENAQTINLARHLRKEKIPCIVEFGKPSKALDFANSQQIPFVVFIGQEEVGKKKFKLRNMGSGKEELLTKSQLIKKIK